MRKCVKLLQGKKCLLEETWRKSMELKLSLFQITCCRVGLLHCKCQVQTTINFFWPISIWNYLYSLNSSKLFREKRSFHTCTTIENAGAICWEGMNDDFFTNWMKIADLVLLASLEVHSSLSKCTRKLPQISSYAPRRFDRQPFTRNKQQSFKFDDRVDQNSQLGIISTPSAPKNFHLMKEPTPRYRNRNSWIRMLS